MKITKVICTITNVMFAITMFVLYMLIVGTIRATDIAIKTRDMINNNIVSAFSDVFVTAYIFVIILTSVIVVAQFICIVHGLFPGSKLKTNGIMKTCVSGIDTIIMISFAIETHKLYAYEYLAFCIILFCLSITQLIFTKKMQ